MEDPRLGERQLEAANRLLGACQPFRGRGAVAALQLGAREDAVEPAAPPGLDQREVGEAGRPQLLDTAVGLADLEPDHADVGVRRAREHAFVE